MKDASSMFIVVYNAMMAGFADQINEHLGRWLFKANEFPGLERRPKLIISSIDKLIELEELGDFSSTIASIMELTDEDLIAIRKKSGFLPPTLADTDESEDLTPETETEAEPEPFPEPDEIETAMQRFRLWARRRSPGIAQLLDRRIE